MCTASVFACVCTAGGCTQGQRPWERPVQARSRRARLPPRQLERISTGGKSRTRPPNCFFFFAPLSRLSSFLLSAVIATWPYHGCVEQAPPPHLSSVQLPPRHSVHLVFSLSLAAVFTFPRRHRRRSVICDCSAMTGRDALSLVVPTVALTHRGWSRRAPPRHRRLVSNAINVLHFLPPLPPARRHENILKRGDGLSQLAAAGRCFVCGRRCSFFFSFLFLQIFIFVPDSSEASCRNYWYSCLFFLSEKRQRCPEN